MSRAEVAAVYELQRQMHRATSDRFERIECGYIAAAASLPDVISASLVQIEPERPLPSLEELRELIERPSSWYPELKHRSLFAAGSDGSRELVLSLARDKQWEVLELQLLVIRQPPRRRAQRVEQLSGNAMRRLKGRLGVEQGLQPRLMGQFERYGALRERVASRAVFAALDQGGKPAALADSYLRGDIAVIEDVSTLRRQRRRGFASSAVIAAVNNALGLGARAVALFAEPPVAKGFYEPLGFEVIDNAFDCEVRAPEPRGRRG